MDIMRCGRIYTLCINAYTVHNVDNSSALAHNVLLCSEEWISEDAGSCNCWTESLKGTVSVIWALRKVGLERLWGCQCLSTHHNYSQALSTTYLQRRNVLRMFFRNGYTSVSPRCCCSPRFYFSPLLQSLFRFARSICLEAIQVVVGDG